MPGTDKVFLAGSAMSLITAPATQQRIAVAIFVSLCCIVPALTPQGKKYQQKLMMSRSGLAELTKRNYALLTVLTCRSARAPSGSGVGQHESADARVRCWQLPAFLLRSRNRVHVALPRPHVH
eukprot:183177-Rhodomonas_salina.5